MLIGVGLIAGPGEIVEMGDLAVGQLALDDHNSPTGRLDECGVVGGFSAAGVGGPQHRGPKGLRRLDGNKGLPRRGIDDHPLAVDPLDRVGDRDTRHGTIRTLGHGTDHRGEELGRGEWTGRVVHADDRCLQRYRGEPGTHGFAACGAAGHSFLGSDIARRHDHDHSSTGRAGNFCRMIDDATSANQLELLRAAESRAGATGDHDGPDNLSCVERHDRRG